VDWHNPSPIRQSMIHRIRLGGNEECLKGWRKNVSPVAGTRDKCGDSTRTPGSWTPLSPSLPALPHLKITILLTPRVLHCPPATPRGPLPTLIVTSGHIGGNDLPRQGRRQTSPKPPAVELGDWRLRCGPWWYFLLALFS